MNIFEWMTSGSQKRAIERFMVKLINHKQLLENKPFPERDEPRMSATFEARVMPWTGKRGDPAEAFFTVTRDVTMSGLSFTAAQVYAPEERLAVSIYFQMEFHHLLCEVRHCTSLGHEENLVGCVVVAKLDPTPELAIPLRN